mmetsp:Transcript_24519/g.35903  ORF Transcript_24519/g.35903 Transcript_24519/m.35903 type:complete len:402 (-) Transcript_24519:22-1227(-)
MSAPLAPPPPPPRRCPMSVAMLTIMMSIPIMVQSYSSNYNAYNYDMTTPMFTPDGRLLQVEYAGLSSDYSTPLLAIPVMISGNDDDDDDDCGVVGVVMASLLPGDKIGANDGNEQGQQQERGGGGGGGQRRIIEIPIGGAKNSVVLGLSGVLADNMALVRGVRRHLEGWHRSYGYTTIPSSSTRLTASSSSSSSSSSNASSSSRVAKRISNVIGDACQSHSFGGGIRPYGATILVCGVDCNQSTPRMSICTTHPSGSVVSYPNIMSSAAAGGGGCVVIGGNDKVQSRVKTRVKDLLLQSNNPDKQNNEERSNEAIQSALRAAVLTLLEEHHHHHHHANPNNPLRQQQQKQKNNGNNDRDAKDKDNGSSGLPMFDLVVFTSRGGVYRLSRKEVTRVVKQCET